MYFHFWHALKKSTSSKVRRWGMSRMRRWETAVFKGPQQRLPYAVTLEQGLAWSEWGNSKLWESSMPAGGVEPTVVKLGCLRRAGGRSHDQCGVSGEEHGSGQVRETGRCHGDEFGKPLESLIQRVIQSCLCFKSVILAVAY